MAKNEAEPVEVVRPTSQVDLEQRLAADFRTDGATDGPVTSGGHLVVSGPAFVGDGNDPSAYVGVDPIYQNYANETEKPFAFEGVEGESVEHMLGNQFAVGRDAPVETERTLGGGSNYETVYTKVSGSDFEPELVDREALAEEAEAAEKSQSVSGSFTVEEEEKPAKKAAAPATPSKS